MYVLREYPVLSETFVRNEIAALRRAGTSVTVWSLRPGSDGKDDRVVQACPSDVPTMLVFWLRFLGTRPLRVVELLRRIAMLRCRGFRAFSRTVPSLFEQIDPAAAPDRVHGHFFGPGANSTMYLAAMLGVDVSLTVHARDIYLTPEGMTAQARLSEPLVTVCHYNVDLLVAAGSSRDNVVVVPCGVSDADVRQYRDGFDVVCVARLVSKKGVDVLLAAASTVRTSFPAMTLAIVGGGPLECDLHRMSSDLGLDDIVTFLGETEHDDALDLIGNAKVFCLPCRIDSDGDSDALPVVLREAAARGTPIVSTAVAGIPEVVNADTGWLVAPDDPVLLSAALTEALGDVRERTRRADRARKLVKETGSLEIQAQALLAAWGR